MTDAAQGVRLIEVVSGLDSPVQTVALPGPDDRLWVVEQPGRVRLIAGGTLAPEPVLDISTRVKSGGEQGLLSLALHPDFDRNGLLYLHLSDPAGDTRVEERTFAWSIAEAGDAREPRREPITVEQLVSFDAAPEGTVHVTSGSGTVRRLAAG